ncbi:MAG: hypothetical protein GC182_23395 [Rhodopseudomonas sp.]|nr:hypothetical protein [Rhodopseudomonas sp.]
MKRPVHHRAFSFCRARSVNRQNAACLIGITGMPNKFGKAEVIGSNEKATTSTISDSIHTIQSRPKTARRCSVRAYASRPDHSPFGGMAASGNAS